MTISPSECCCYKLDDDTIMFAAENGHLECLRYAHENGAPWSSLTCMSAGKNGHLECLRYAHENGAPWDEWTCVNAAQNGHLECLRYAHEHGAPWGPQIMYAGGEVGVDGSLTTRNAAENGHLECLHYAHENGAPWDKHTCGNTAFYGHLACLKYAHENGAPWNEDTCKNAAHNGHFSCLKYAHENGAPWNEDTCTCAAYNGHFECLCYAFLIGAPCHDAPPEMIAWRQRIRDTAGKILRTYRAIRVRSANTIKFAWLEYFYRPENNGLMLAKAHFMKVSRPNIHKDKSSMIVYGDHTSRRNPGAHLLVPTSP